MWWAKRNARRPSSDFIAVFSLEMDASVHRPRGVAGHLRASGGGFLHSHTQRIIVSIAAGNAVVRPLLRACLRWRAVCQNALRESPRPQITLTLSDVADYRELLQRHARPPRVIFICRLHNKHAETNIVRSASVIEGSVLQSFLAHPVFFFNHFPHDPHRDFFIARRAVCHAQSGIQVFIREGVELRPSTEARLVPSHNLHPCNSSHGCHCRGCGMQASATRDVVMSC